MNDSQNDFTGRTILVIDDTPSTLRVMFDYLEKQGFRVRIASNGFNALRSIEQEPPDIILLDIMMPGMDGFEICRQLKSSEVSKDIPVIFMTARSETNDKLEAFNIGAVDYVIKPIEPPEVLARIVAHLKIQDLRRQLLKSNALKDQIFSIIAHDLKGPFMPLLGHLEALAKYTATGQLASQDISEMAMYAHSSAQRIYSLLENLLQLARIQRCGVEYNPVILDLREVSSKVLDLLSVIDREKGISLSLQMGSSVEQWIVYADQQLLSTVLRNLISNALKFTSPGGHVIVSAAHHGSKFIEVSVSDTGVGISAADQVKLLETGVHRTTLGTSGERGTGLGLIICQEMIKKLQGRIWIESELDQGTTVRFTILAAPDALSVVDGLSQPNGKSTSCNKEPDQFLSSLQKDWAQVLAS
jgi:signal transduction histidine kinase